MMMTQLIADKQGFMSGHIPDLSMSSANTALLSEPIPFLHQQSGNSLAIIHDTLQGKTELGRAVCYGFCCPF